MKVRSARSILVVISNRTLRLIGRGRCPGALFAYKIGQVCLRKPLVCVNLYVVAKSRETCIAKARLLIILLLGMKYFIGPVTVGGRPYEINIIRGNYSIVLTALLAYQLNMP